MGERCTVFIESDLVHHQQSGAQRDDLIAGLSYSIVQTISIVWWETGVSGSNLLPGERPSTKE